MIELQVLYNANNQEVMRFEGNKPKFKQVDFESFCRLSPFEIPSWNRAEFSGRTFIHFPKKESSEEDFDLYKKAFINSIQGNSYRGFRWVVSLINKKEG